MTNNLKCFFCGAELKNDVNLLGYSTKYWYCENTSCAHLKDSMHEDVWQALIQTKQDLEYTRKALDIAIDALKEYTDEKRWDWERSYELHSAETAKKALEQITAL